MLKNRFANCIFLVLLIIFSSASQAQRKWPNTLLWRISGNGLSKPSYLFGTMHLQDKRIFNLSDSLYSYLDQADGFALEVDFKEYIDSAFKRMFEKKENEILNDEEQVKINPKKYGKDADSLLKELGIKQTKFTKKQLKEIREYRINKVLEKGEMPTILDAYLFGIASRKGKWLGAVEDVLDQLDLSDELGADITADDVFIPETRLRLSLEQMISIYSNQDLNSIEVYASQMKPDVEDKMLTKRNIKMARRMDSLSHLRSMFFAVGAAHLPGDSGVIRLLRQKGFSVDPVFSSVKIPAEKYLDQLPTRTWAKVEDRDKFYAVEMPGEPSPHNLFGDLLQMRIFFDISTMTYYMSGHTIGGRKNDSEIYAAMDDMIKNMGGIKSKSTKRKIVGSNGLSGVEANVQSLSGYYKVQLFQKDKVLYMLMAGSNKKMNLESTDVKRFFSSFTVNAKEVTSKDWVEFALPEKGVSVSLPGQPKPNRKFEQQAEGSEWVFKVFDYVDLINGRYYIFQVRDPKKGYFLESDSTYFSLFKENMKDEISVDKEELTTYKGLPALRFDGTSNKEDYSFSTLNVIRGNRIYTLMITTDKNSAQEAADTYFNSLAFEPYQPATWKLYTGPGFQTWAPSAFEKDDEEEKEEEHFIAHNEHQLVSYEVFRTPIPRYYWIESDTAYLKAQVTNYSSSNDSLLYQKYVYNGKLKGVEILFLPENQTLRKKARIFVNGDTLYTLVAFIPEESVNDPNHSRFFEDFRVSNEKEPSIYTSKAKELIEALQTKDSTEFSEVTNAFYDVTFTSKDLPHLHKAITRKYLDYDPDQYTINDKMINILHEINDPSTIEFVKNTYNTIEKENEELKYDLLGLLARFKTKQSYALLKELLTADLPSKGNAEMLITHLTDSLELSRNLFPDLLKLSSDTLFVKTVMSVANTLIDSNLLTLNDVLPYKQHFINGAKRMLIRVQTEERDYWWRYTDWVDFLGKFNDGQTNALLQQFLKLKALEFKQAAIIALAKNNQTVSPAEIEKVAENKEYRVDLYEGLKKLGREKLFSAKYSNQKSLAESELYLIGSDEYDVSSITFIGERTTAFLGKRKKFYLFKITFDYGEDGTGSYLAVTGPYDPASKNLVTSTIASGFFGEETYDKTKVDKQFKAYLAAMEDYYKDNPVAEKMK